jgi:hypothetical protein
MKFAINIESGYGTNVFRLNNQNVWIICNNSSLLNSTDYQTSNPSDIISKQERDLILKINGEDFEIEPDLGTELGNEKQLHYSVYGFRQNYPNPPDENQLLQLLLSGNDAVRNVLVLKTDGQFYLLSQSQIIDYVSNPEYVMQCEGFQPHNGYVGSSINNNKIRNYVQNLFKVAVYHWVKHLKDKELHDFMDIILNPDEDHIPEIIDLFSELDEIKNKWTPDY